jgi:sigma-E factor negative regulatory protein RseC
MLEETAMVVSISQGHAMVALVRSEACGDCAAKSMCNPASDNTMQMEVENPVGAKPGERVIIELPPEALLKASTLAYLFPATVMVIGATVGWSRTGTDMGALIGALVGFTASSLYLFIYSRRKKFTQGPAISKVLNSGGIPQDDHDQ